MAQTIQIKRSANAGKPTAVAQGELFYAYGAASDAAGYGKRLSIGHVDGGGNTPEIIGGKHFMDMLGGTSDIKGTLTANSAIIVDSDKRINELQIKNQGDLKLFEATANGAHSITLQAPASLAGDITFTLPTGTGSNGYILSTNGSGVLSWAAQSGTLTVGADSGSDDAVTLGTDTLDFVGTANEIETTVSNNQIQIGLPENVTISGNLTVSGDTTTVNTSTLAVEDPLLALATGNTSTDAIDIGLYGLYDTSGSQDLYGGLFRDANDSGKWKLFKDSQVEPTTTINVSGTGYAVATLVANIEAATATISGGTISGITDLAVADGGTGLSAVAKGAVLVANTANTLSALDGGGSADGMLLYTSSSDTISWSTTVDGGTYS